MRFLIQFVALKGVAEGMGKRFRLFALLLAVAILAGCAAKDPSVYAVVNGVEITREDVNRYASLVWFEPDVELTAEDKAYILDALIRMQVYSQAALARGLEFDSEKAEEEYDFFRDQVTAEKFAGNVTAFYARMEELDLTKEWLLDFFRRSIIIDDMLAEELEKVQEPDDADVEDYYNQNKEKYAHDELRRIRHILVNKGNFPDAEEDEVADLTKNLANEIYQRLLDGEDFAELAKEYSQDVSGKAGGDIGWWEKKTWSKSLPKWRFPLSPASFPNSGEHLRLACFRGIGGQGSRLLRTGRSAARGDSCRTPVQAAANTLERPVVIADGASRHCQIL